MREFLSAWIIFQLLFIGAFYGSLSYDINSNNCEHKITDAKEYEYIIIGIIFPLLAFNTADNIANNKCSNKD